MSIAALIRRMTEAGAPPEAIAIAVEEIEGIQTSLESRRVADRDRKRAQREAQKTADVTGQSEDSPHNVSGIPSPLNPPLKVSPKPPSNTPPLKSPLPQLLRGIGLPVEIPAEPWLAFVRMRKAIPKVPFTEDAARGVVRKCTKLAAQGYDPEKLLWKAVDHGWRTVFDHEDCKGAAASSEWSAERQAQFLREIAERDAA